MKYNIIFYSIGFLILIISNILVNNNYLDASYQNNITSYEIKK
nr:hypothetical protein [uncultured Mediterranean phage uvMED]